MRHQEIQDCVFLVLNSLVLSNYCDKVRLIDMNSQQDLYQFKCIRDLHPKMPRELTDQHILEIYNGFIFEINVWSCSWKFLLYFPCQNCFLQYCQNKLDF